MRRVIKILGALLALVLKVRSRTASGALVKKTAASEEARGRTHCWRNKPVSEANWTS